MNRDTQFRAAARLLIQQIDTTVTAAFTPGADDEALAKSLEQSIVHWAYDFAQHVIDSCVSQEQDACSRLSDWALIQNIPDMTEWSEEQAEDTTQQRPWQYINGQELGEPYV